MIEINLLPDSVLVERKQRQLKRVAQFGFTAFMVGVGGLVLLSFGYLQLRTTQLNAAKDKHSQTYNRVYSTENINFRNQAVAVQKSLDAVSSLTANPRSTDALLRDLSRLTPQSVKIETLGFDTDNRILVEGQATSYDQVSRFITILTIGSAKAASPSLLDFTQANSPFSEVKLAGTNQAGPGLVSFSIFTHYTPPLDDGTEEAQ